MALKSYKIPPFPSPISLFHNNECPRFLLFIMFYKTSNEFVLELPINVLSFLDSGSVPSLAAGLLFGSLAGLGAYQLSQNPSNVWISLSKSFSILFTKEYIYPKTSGY